MGGRVAFFRYNGHMFYVESIQHYLLYFLVQFCSGISDQRKKQLLEGHRSSDQTVQKTYPFVL